MRRARSTDEFRQKNILIAARRRARRRSSDDGTVTLSAVKALLKPQENRCNYCMISFDIATKHLDHIVPLAKGGPHSISNVQFLCSTCNLTKWCK